MPKPTLKVRTSWDDGSVHDFKIVEILEKYHLKGTFYIPGNCGLKPNEIQAIDQKGFTIGAHTHSHPMDMKLLSATDQRHQIQVNRRWLEELIGKPVTTFAYPRGRYNDTTVDILRELGFTEARTTVVGNVFPAQDPLRTHTSFHFFRRPEYGSAPMEMYGKILSGQAAACGGVFHVWGHGFELDHYNYWKPLSEFFRWLKGKYDVQAID